MTLAMRKCVTCRSDSSGVTRKEITDLHPAVRGWEITEEGSIPHLERTFKFEDFAEAMSFATKVGVAADEEDHHPRIIVEWGSANVAWWTHKIRGLHRNDFIMAAKTDVIFAESS